MSPTTHPPLRILFLTPYFRPYLGGIERAVEQLSLQLLNSPQVAAIGVLTAKYAFPRIPHPEWPDQERTPQGIELFRLTGFPQRPPPFYSVPLVWFSPRQIRRYIHQFNPNIIHFVGDGWFWGHWQAWRVMRRRARFIFTPSYHPLPLAHYWLRPLNRRLCRAVDQVVALTHHESLQLQRDYRVDPTKLSLIGWGASPLTAPDNPAHRALPNSAPDAPIHILCVGRLGRHKGQDWLLETYRQARPRFRTRPSNLCRRR